MVIYLAHIYTYVNAQSSNDSALILKKNLDFGYLFKKEKSH